MGAAAKEARTRTSTEPALRLVQPPTGLTDEPASDWHPDRISDRKLLELRNRLERLRQLGGTFAAVDFSDAAKQRLRQLGTGNGAARAR